MSLTKLLLIVSCTLVLAACGRNGDSSEPKADDESLPPPFAKLLPLHTKLGKPRRGEWLAEHSEPGQTYRQYVASDPVRVDKRRNKIYVQPLGEFTAAQRKIVDQTAECLGLYYGLKVQTLDDLPLSVIPAKARRKHPSWGMDQILSTYVLSDVLQPRLPKDACASIALTASDLWPGEGWNFVFGQASLSERVGVWSLYRNGAPEKSDADYRLCLLRTLKTATHETGHMFSLMHCTRYECNLCGSNHLDEADSHPLAVCPVCLAKICYATGVDPQQRFEKLIAFYKRAGLTAEQDFCQKSLDRLRAE